MTDQLGNSIEGRLVLTINGVIINIDAAENAENSINIAFGPNVSVRPKSRDDPKKQSVKEIEEAPTTKQIDVASLIENEVGLPGDYQVVPESGKYPAPPSPEGKPKNEGIIPTVIKNTRADYVPERDSRKISVDEVKRNAAFNRQINANKAVANLLAIIQQLTANVNAAKADVIALEKVLAAAQAENNACNEKIFGFANTRTKIENAINSRVDKINEVNKEIANILPMIEDLKKKRDELVAERTILENELSPNA